MFSKPMKIFTEEIYCIKSACVNVCMWYASANRLLPPSHAEVNLHGDHVNILRLKI